jgi:Rrf2 family protein
MQISAKTEYACIAVLDLAISYESGEPLQVRKIAAAHDIPSGFLVQILLHLKSAGLVTSTRGAAGGYRLSRPADEISVWDVMSAVEGEARGLGPPARSSAARVLNETWDRAAESSRQLLQTTTFADLTERAGGAAQGMYFI